MTKQEISDKIEDMELMLLEMIKNLSEIRRQLEEEK